MSDANPERGEHELTLGGVTYRLRPSFAAIVAIEKKTDRSLLVLARDMASGALPTSTIGVVAAELIRAGAEEEMTRRVSAEQIAILAYEDGLPVVALALSLCLRDAAMGGRDRLGEARAPVASPETGEAAGAE